MVSIRPKLAHQAFFCFSILLVFASCSSGEQSSKINKESGESSQEPVEISVKEQTKADVTKMITPLLEKNGFKYDKEIGSFTRSKADYVDEITVQTNNKADFYFHFGRNFPAVAQMVAPYQPKKHFSTPDLTVWDSSMNAGPNFAEHYSVEGAWNYSKETEKEVNAGVSKFIDEFLLAWLAKYPDMKTAREKLERRPMIKAETTIQILAIDVLLNDKEAFHQELVRAMPDLENSTTHDAAQKVQSFANDIYSKHPEFKQK